MTLPDPAQFDASPLELAHRHMARVSYLAAQAEQQPDMPEVESNRIRREQLEGMTMARLHAEMSRAESLARIADAVERLVSKEQQG